MHSNPEVNEAKIEAKKIPFIHPKISHGDLDSNGLLILDNNRRVELEKLDKEALLEKLNQEGRLEKFDEKQREELAKLNKEELLKLFDRGIEIVNLKIEVEEKKSSPYGEYEIVEKKNIPVPYHVHYEAKLGEGAF